jgi:orotidine-5'-phosphate decarboxylase
MFIFLTSLLTVSTSVCLKLCDTFNTFFVNVTNDIGKEVIFDGNSHPSILKIKNNTQRQHNTLFDFKHTDVDTVSKLVKKINIKKATGVDQFLSTSTSFLKICVNRFSF